MLRMLNLLQMKGYTMAGIMSFLSTFKKKDRELTEIVDDEKTVFNEGERSSSHEGEVSEEDETPEVEFDVSGK